jgi:hypothetical protein
MSESSFNPVVCANALTTIGPSPPTWDTPLQLTADPGSAGTGDSDTNVWLDSAAHAYLAAFEERLNLNEVGFGSSAVGRAVDIYASGGSTFQCKYVGPDIGGKRNYSFDLDYGSAGLAGYDAYCVSGFAATQSSPSTIGYLADTSQGLLNAFTTPLIGIFKRKRRLDASTAVQQFAEEKRRASASAVKTAETKHELSPNFAEQLYRLIDVVSDEFPQTDYPSPLAIDAFARAIVRLVPLIHTAVSAMPDGGLWAQWRTPTGTTAAMLAKRSGALAFGAVLPSETIRQTRVDVSGGIAAVNQVLSNRAFAGIFGSR